MTGDTSTVEFTGGPLPGSNLAALNTALACLPPSPDGWGWKLTILDDWKMRVILKSDGHPIQYLSLTAAWDTGSIREAGRILLERHNPQQPPATKE